MVDAIGDWEPEILAEQAEYYRARAPEYDKWFYRQGRYDQGREATALWFSELEEVRAALAGLPIDGADCWSSPPAPAFGPSSWLAGLGT